MTLSEARSLAEAHVSDELVVLEKFANECTFGFYFAISSRAYEESGKFENMLIGSSGLLVDRGNGKVHELGSGADLEYWFKAYQRNLHLPQTLIVTKVHDRQRAADALLRLHMSFVIPEEEGGVIWRIPQYFSVKQIRNSLDSLPCQFEGQDFIFRLRDIEAIEADNNLEIELQSNE